MTSGQAFQAAHGSLARHTDQSRGARGSWEGCGEPEDKAPSAPHSPCGTALCGVQPVTGCRTKQPSPTQITTPAHPVALPSPHVAELRGHQGPHPHTAGSPKGVKTQVPLAPRASVWTPRLWKHAKAPQRTLATSACLTAPGTGLCPQPHPSRPLIPNPLAFGLSTCYSTFLECSALSCL